jgi:exosortase K
MKYTRTQVIVFLFFFIIAYSIKENFVVASEPIMNLFLQPVAIFISIFFNKSYHYSISDGFVFNGLGISIEQSCSGLNFFIIALSTFVFFWISDKNPDKLKFGYLFLALILTYILTLIVNVLRITSSILMLKVDVLGGIFAKPMAHKIIGALIFMSLLMIFSNVLFFIFNKYIYEKSTQS